MRISDQDAVALGGALRAKTGRLWREVVCEVHRHGDEVPIFVLVTDPGLLHRAVAEVIAVARPWTARFDETEVSIGLDGSVDGRLMTLDFITPDEVRGGTVTRPLGRTPIEGDARHSVFASVRG